MHSMNGSSGNHDAVKVTPWGPAQEVERPVRGGARRTSKYVDLVTDAVLRLEKTDDDRAIMYPFPDRKAARSAASSVRKRIERRLGKGFASVSFRTNPPALYVMRGPNYQNTK